MQVPVYGPCGLLLQQNSAKIQETDCSKETRNGAVQSQTTIWIRFVKGGVEQVELAFNSRILAVYNLSDIDEIVSEMITHMAQQIENPALEDSKFVFDEVIHMNIDFHRLNLTRGSSYILYQTG